MSENTPKDIISDDEIEHVHANANFGSISKRDVVKYTILKYACGWHSGSFARSIVKEHGLLTKADTLTKKGKRYLWASFGKIDL